MHLMIQIDTKNYSSYQFVSLNVEDIKPNFDNVSGLRTSWLPQQYQHIWVQWLTIPLYLVCLNLSFYILRLHENALKKAIFSKKNPGASPPAIPHQGLRPWTPLGAAPPDPCWSRLALLGRHFSKQIWPLPGTFQLYPSLWNINWLLC